MNTNMLHSANHSDEDKKIIHSLLEETFRYFLEQTDAHTGLIADKSDPESPCSIAVVGMGLSAYVAGVENNLISKEEASARVLKILRFFYSSPQGTEPDATGYKGFYYHFLDMKTGKRVWNSELSTIDSAFLIAGILSAAAYFSGDSAEETEIKKLADILYRRVDWQWALDSGECLSHGWTPESGFLPYRWDQQYSEAMILYMLAMGSPTHPISPDGYKKWTATFEKIKVYDMEYLYAGPLFIHQFSHLWLDFKGIQDDINKKYGFDYFENSRRATHVHRKYASENAGQFANYNEHFWGLSASDGPGDKELLVDGKKRSFFGYLSRGAPYGPDDGTVSPWSVVASLPFAADIVMETIRHFVEKFDLKKPRLYGFESSFNPTYPDRKRNPNGWVSPCSFGLNQGAIVIMIANDRSGIIWNLMRNNKYIIQGLKSAGFSGGWLTDSVNTPVNHL